MPWSETCSLIYSLNIALPILQDCVLRNSCALKCKPIWIKVEFVDQSSFLWWIFGPSFPSKEQTVKNFIMTSYKNLMILKNKTYWLFLRAHPFIDIFLLFVHGLRLLVKLEILVSITNPALSKNTVLDLYKF